MFDHSAAHQAYLPIVAASTRASTLHYCCNDRAFAWGPVCHRDIANSGTFSGEGKELLPQVLLIDAGCEWDCYSSDSKYWLYETLLEFDLGADLVCVSDFLDITIDHSHAYNASWQRREVHGGSKEGVRACTEDAIRTLLLRFYTSLMPTRQPWFV